ncbi:hypothetical protein VIGAN_11048500 [Vigna angularis var. angularis]|uniref:Uncharacterized protein n=1 Tax=Vigna angularis var. angularis TaxID=157739 RepID=A0A0S3T8M4_PHAAN|nr:hypothetical protein VIGAN_11048500 [Vigna angularis var. angularis]
MVSISKKRQCKSKKVVQENTFISQNKYIHTLISVIINNIIKFPESKDTITIRRTTRYKIKSNLTLPYLGLCFLFLFSLALETLFLSFPMFEAPPTSLLSSKWWL